ncbi:hypothetical protein PF008_g21879 [Phytophthora fragariae]|uniref:Uncharacterized protein n=1 Tax=Phytophthora fragariae TaxID=53985 RepID=A0A6G0QVG8_9STRA|nr:hypothetical protein PF008_g21879 [Phytophthora fragariae]
MAPSSPSAPARPGSSEDGENGGLTRGYSKRGDGFSVQETEGMLQQVRDRWQEGWDVIAELHNAQFPGHKRSASSLKRKFAKLYRFKIDANTKEKHARAAAMAKKVREEMRGQRRGLIGTPALSEDLVAETEVQEVHQDLTEVEMITPQPGSHNHALPEPAVTASEHELRQTLTQSVVMPQETPMRDDAWQAAINRLPVAGDRLHTLRAQIENGETTASQDLVLLVLLESQHQRDLEREQEREERRQEKLRWQEEMREQRRRHEQDRAEDRRKNEQFMQVMTTLVAQIAAGQQQRTGVN